MFSLFHTCKTTLYQHRLTYISFLTETLVWAGVLTGTTYSHIQGTNHLVRNQKYCHMQQLKLDDATCLFRTSSSVHALDRSPVSSYGISIEFFVDHLSSHRFETFTILMSAIPNCFLLILFSRLYNVSTSSCAHLTIILSSSSSCLCHSSLLPFSHHSAQVSLGLPRFLFPGGRHFILLVISSLPLFEHVHTIEVAWFYYRLKECLTHI